MRAKSVRERLYEKVSKTDDGCFVFQGAAMGKGYASISVEGRMRAAHRVSWELDHRRPIPEGLQVDHLCRNRRCINPDHLELVTPRVNVLRSRSSFEFNGMCLAGLHDMGDPANVSYRSDGGRQCHPCKLAGKRRYRETKKLMESKS